MGNELKPDDITTEKLNKSNDPDDKSDALHTEQIDSPITSKNLEVCDRDSEEWEELSNKEHLHVNGGSPETSHSKVREIEIESLNQNDNARKPQKKLSNKKKIIVVSSNKKKPNIQSPRIKGIQKMPKLQHLKKDGFYLAVGSGVNLNNQQRKSKLYSENRQFT